MSSDKRIRASRENGKKGGVKTDAGKARSAANALKHGLYAHKYSPILSTEILEDFEDLQQKLLQAHNPQNHQERLTVDQLIDCAWRIGRYEIAQEHFLEIELNYQRPGLEKLNPAGIDNDLRMSLALHHCLSVNNSAFNELGRLIARYHRIQDRLLKRLKDLQGPRFGTNPMPQQEPDTTSNQKSGNEPSGVENKQPRPWPVIHRVDRATTIVRSEQPRTAAQPVKERVMVA
jgi:hypothetical protein